MSLQFIMGPSGAGKSHYLYQWVTNESMKNPEKTYIVLVPEQFTMQTQKDLVMVNPQKGILNVEVLSFNRLAHRVMEEVGDNKRVILDDVGKNFVIRKVAGKCMVQLQVLGGNLKKMGYISEMKSILSELAQYDIKPEDMNGLIEQTEKYPGLHYKLKDIQVIYEAFQNYMEKKYITGEEVLDILASSVPKSKLLAESVIVLDGFTGFTPIQKRLLKELLRVCEKMVVTTTMDKRENPYEYKHPYQLFALSKEMVVGLIKVANEVSVSIDKPILFYDRPIYRFRNSEGLDFLEENLFRYTSNSYDKETNDVQIWCADRPQEEVDFVAQTVRKLVRTKNYRYKDIAILVSDMQAYAGVIEQVFEKYQLPIFMDHKRSILANSCVEYIRSLLAMAEQNFTYESVFRYMRTGLMDIQQDDVDILENYVLALGIKGYKKWQEKWIRRPQGMKEEELAKINDIREKFVESIADVMEVLKQTYKTVLDVTKALHSFFLKEGLQQRVKDYQLKFEQQGELALGKEYAQVYRIVVELLDQFVELLGDERISLKEYCELFDAGLEEAKVGVIPPSIDQIVIGDVERSRIKDVKVVFLLGANDVYIPGSSSKNSLLSENDRQKIISNGIVLAPGAKEKTYIQKFYIYLALTKPSTQVCLTCSKTTADGNPLRPSYLVYDLLKLFPKLSMRDIPKELYEKELTAESAIQSIVQGLQKKREGFTNEWKELYNWYIKHPKWRVKIEKLVEASFYRNEGDRITREVAEKLYGDISHCSVTRLEKFAACAYAHFLQYGLRLREREIYQLQQLDIGNIFHTSIEKYSIKLQHEGYTWGSIPEDKQEKFIYESVDETITDYGNSVIYSSARNEYLVTKLKRMLKRSVWALTTQLSKGDFVPTGYEVKFGGGKIDRVDICETDEKVYVNVTDYKTGSKTFDLGELCYGLQVQLVVYLNAAVDMQKQKHPEKEVVPAGLFYYHVDDPIVERPTGEKTVEDLILKQLRLDGMVQASEEVIQHFDRGFTGDSQVIPVNRLKSGGLGKYSKILSEEEFQVISEFTRQHVQKTKEQIQDGDIEIRPYSLGDKNGCGYCPYRSVCGFDEKVPGYEYNELEKLDNQTALDKMREEAGAWE